MIKRHLKQRHQNNSANSFRGFTLLELMITVAIVAIIAAVALPSYQRQIEKTRRGVAKADLVELASFMQRFYTENNRFDQDTGGTAVALPFTKSPKDGTDSFYAITLTGVGQTTYQLQAAPQNTQSGDSCGTLTLAHTGAKTAATSNCW